MNKYKPWQKPKVKIKYNKYRKAYEVWLVNKVQSFRFAYEGSKKECLWYRKMLKKAGV